MIVNINTPNCLSNSNKCNHNNESFQILTTEHPLTKNLIKVTSSDCDCVLIGKEKDIYNSAKANAFLKSSVAGKSNDNQMDRFNSLGITATDLGNGNEIEDGKAKKISVEIIAKHPSDPSLEPKSDPSITKRGAEFMKKLLKIEAKPGTGSQLATTCYSTAIDYGSGSKNGLLDSFELKHVNQLWNIGLDLPTKN